MYYRVISRFSKILWTNLKLKWKDENVIDLFLKTAERVPSKVRTRTDENCRHCVSVPGDDDFL